MPDLSSRPDIGLTPGVLEGGAPGLPPPAAATPETTTPEATPKADDLKTGESNSESSKTDEPSVPATKTDTAPDAAAEKKSD
jgi:hypothetical protein